MKLFQLQGYAASRGDYDTGWLQHGHGLLMCHTKAPDFPKRFEQMFPM
jgi:hypothetical protein